MEAASKVVPRLRADRLRAAGTRLLAVRPLRMRTALLAGAVVVLAAWPVATIEPSVGLDASWRASLQLALVHHLHFGRDYVFTYGPLGFLDVPQLYVTALGAAALVFVVASQLALAALLVRRLAAVFPLPAALLGAYAVATLPVDRADLGLLALFVACVATIVRSRAGVRLSAFAIPAAAYAGVALLVKVNDGALAIVLVALVLVGCARDARPVVAAAATFLAAFLAAWLATRQSLGDLRPFGLGIAAIVTGYTPAMMREQAGRHWEYGAALVLAAALVVLAWTATSRLDPRRRVAFLCLALVFGWAEFKEGFVRHDAHSVAFFTATAVAAAAFVRAGRLRWLAAASFAGAFAAAAVAMHTPFFSTVDPVASLHRAASQSWLLLDRGHRRLTLAADRRAGVRDLRLDPSFVRRLVGDRTVDVEPYQIAAAWALRLHWRGTPVPQAYSAYTPYLDDLNARSLLGPDAPERMLRQPDDVLIDDHGISTEAPASWLAILCRYRQLAVRGSWQVLARAPNRCGTERPLGRASATHGSFVRVPAARPDELVVARFTLPSTGSPLRLLLYKPAGFPVVAFRQGDETDPFRIAAANAGQPIVVRVPRTAGFAEGFGGELRADAVAIRELPGRYSVRFFAIPLRR